MAEQQTKPLTLRVPEELHEQLRTIAETTRRPMNKVVLAALRQFLPQESQRLAEQLSPRLEKLRQYAADPDRRRAALEAVASDEAEHGAADPAEGSRVVIAPAD